MNLLWDYFWPVLAAGLVVGLVAGSVGFRRGRRKSAIAVGCAATIAAAALWHGPTGAGDRFAGTVDRIARQALDHYEMATVNAQLHRGPLTRRLILSGPADDFQRRELVRLFSEVPGVSGARWAGGSAGAPMIAEAIGAALAAFLAGLLLAWLIELRRRYNAQWTW
jgi:hypothetical protein